MQFEINLYLVVGAALILGYFVYKFLLRNKGKKTSGEEQRRIAILEKEFPYYNKLPEKSKAIFAKKLNEFYSSKYFIAKRGFEVDERKKVLICASAAQLTFGLPMLKLSHFENILIFDKRSHIRNLEQFTYADQHKQGGKMYFSWEEIQMGLDNPNDGFNIALHKMAEALLFEDHKPNDEFNFLNQEILKELEHL